MIKMSFLLFSFKRTCFCVVFFLPRRSADRGEKCSARCALPGGGGSYCGESARLDVYFREGVGLTVVKVLV